MHVWFYSPKCSHYFLFEDSHGGADDIGISSNSGKCTSIAFEGPSHLTRKLLPPNEFQTQIFRIVCDVLKTIPNFVSLFSLGPHTIGWMQLLGQEDRGNLGEVGRCQNPGLAYFYISPCIYICICEICIFVCDLYLYLYLYFRQFVFVLVIVTRTRKSPRIGSLSKSWISCSSLASLESLAHTSSDLGDSLTLYGHSETWLILGSNNPSRIEKVQISWAWSPPLPRLTLAIVKNLSGKVVQRARESSIQP